MGDVLFDTGKSDLRSEAREALAKLSGIVLNYPSLRLGIEGHTDSTGSANFNQTLSENRASSVRDYLIGQGIDTKSLAAQGFGMDNPVVTTARPKAGRRIKELKLLCPAK
jgi:outer membrane protein OmpA-like peptidoglycan-associated protein